MRPIRFLAAATVVVAALGLSQAAAPAATTPSLRSVMYVGNNWAGTASIVDAKSMTVLKSGINLIPDKAEELARIQSNPDALAYYLVIQQGPGEGHDQYVDDMFATSDGKYLAVSRPSFADVVWIDLAAALTPGSTPAQIIRREQSMDGYRTDHMALSPDGRRLLASDSTAAQVIEFSMVDETLGDRLRSFPSGETPHESNYSSDGSKIFHASIGKVYTPGDDPLLDALKGDRWFQIVNNADFSIDRRWNMGKELAESGRPNMSAAVRPMALGPKNLLYYQVSFFHGLVEFDTALPDAKPASSYASGGITEPATGRVTRVLELPNLIPNVLREQYVNDSAHHGLAISADKKTLCVAGTMDDYIALVDRASFAYKTYLKSPRTPPEGTDGKYTKPYWSTEAPHNRCWVSLSGSDAVAVFDFATKKEVAYLPVGDHPQRIRHGAIVASLVG
ncbi:MAG TPA: serine/threonine protein kinase [Aeromicrobium sp.]|nr:serine/threonine protein kinase [Aeromicrobium sp.]